MDPNTDLIAYETIFKICPEKYMVLAENGTKDVYKIDQSDWMFSITIMIAVST